MKEEASMLNPRLNTLIMMIVSAAATRLIPHPPNLTSVTALAPFGGAYFLNRWLAFVVPLGALLLSDLILGLYPHMEVPYLSFALIVCIGFRLQQHRTAPRIAGATLLSALCFSSSRISACGLSIRCTRGPSLAWSPVIPPRFPSSAIRYWAMWVIPPSCSAASRCWRGVFLFCGSRESPSGRIPAEWMGVCSGSSRSCLPQPRWSAHWVWAIGSWVLPMSVTIHQK